MGTLCCRRCQVGKPQFVLYVIVVGSLFGLLLYKGRLKTGKPVVQEFLRQLKSSDVGTVEVDPVLSQLHLSKESIQLISDKSVDRAKHYNHTWIPRQFVDANLLPDKIVDGVKYFVFFVGHGRGGSSILGSLVDAHPNMVVATDYQLFHKWNENLEYHRNRSVLYTALYIRAKKVAYGYRKFDSRGYSLYIPNAYMGKFQDGITVIGEKEAGSATASFSINKERWVRTFQDIKNTTKVPIKIVQIVRNPFDNIATMTVYLIGGAAKRRELVQNGGQMNNSEILDFRIKAYFRNVHAVYRMQQDERLDIDLHQLHLVDLVRDPAGEMSKLCQHLGVQCYPWYLELCKEHIFSNLSKTRDTVEWTPRQIAEVELEIGKVPWLKRYDYESD